MGAAQYMVEEKGRKNISCIGLAIPNVGPWSCGALEEYMTSKGLTGSSVYLNPGSPDVNSGLLEAVASGRGHDPCQPARRSGDCLSEGGGGAGLWGHLPMGLVHAAV